MNNNYHNKNISEKIENRRFQAMGSSHISSNIFPVFVCLVFVLYTVFVLIKSQIIVIIK